MTAEELDALAADVGKDNASHSGCDVSRRCRQLLELARGYLSLRLVQADHERHMAALQAAYDDVQAAYLRVCGDNGIRAIYDDTTTLAAPLQYTRVNLSPQKDER